MKRREFMKIIAAGTVSMLLPEMPLRAGGSSQPPNFIVVMVDDCSAKEFSCYGNTQISTPNIDQLGATGIKFKTCWATPICSPTRAMIMTGRYCFKTGWYHNNLKPDIGERGYNLSEWNIPFSTFLKSAGYATAICGKWQLRGTETQHGFDEWCIWRALPGQFDGPIEPPEGNLPGRPARYWHPAIDNNGVQMNTDDDDYGADLFTDFLLDFADRHKNDPFLVYFPMCLTHKTWDFDLEVMGYVAPPELDETGNRTGNKGEPSLKGNVEYVDALMKRITDGLETIGVRDNTIIIFTCDNGTVGYGKGNPDQEKGPRAAGIVNCPGIVSPIGASDALFSLADILPTLCDFAGVTIPDTYPIDGVSQAPVFRGETEHVRDYIFACLYKNYFLRDTRWLLDGNGKFWDCGSNRDETGYLDVTGSTDPEVIAARARLKAILSELQKETWDTLPTVTGKHAACYKK